MADLACKLVNGDGEYNLRAVNSIGVDPNYKQMFNHMKSGAWNTNIMIAMYKQPTAFVMISFGS